MTAVLALFGAGRIGAIHAANIARDPDAVLKYVVDIDPHAAARLADAFGATAGAADDVFDDAEVQGVVIATSTDTHLSLIAAAARAGKATLCEKPLDLDVDDARSSVAAARAAGVPLFVGFNRRYDPTFRRLKNELDAGRIGAVEVVSITSRDPAPPPVEYVRRSGGLIRDMSIHDLDMARWLLGEEPIRAFASGSCLVDPAIGKAGDIDTAVIVLKTARGAFCQITNSRRCSYGYDQRIEAFGESGMLAAGNETATRLEHADPSGFHRDPALPFFVERYREAYRLEIAAFVAALQGRPNGLADGADGLRALVLADAAERSAASGEWVEVPA